MKTELYLSEREMFAKTYKFLSDCYHPPDEKLIHQIDCLDTRESELCLMLSESKPTLNELEVLKIDYSKLFIGPFKLLAPPYGSIYLEDKGIVMGESTIDVKRRYQEEGLEICLKEVPDHITIELEFMYFLIMKEIEALQKSDEQLACAYRMKQESFLSIHLGAWAPEFTKKILLSAQTKFYKSLAQVTGLFLVESLNFYSDGGWDNLTDFSQ